MKKIYALQAPGKHPDRVLDAVRHDIRQQFKRLRARALPEGGEVWRFACKMGPDESQAESIAEADLSAAVQRWAEQGATQIYLEVVAHSALRGKRPASGGQGSRGASDAAASSPE
ncbi:MAG: hypothetical protein RL357_1548 [Pseudomonadota bacterium]